MNRCWQHISTATPHISAILLIILTLLCCFEIKADGTDSVVRNIELRWDMKFSDTGKRSAFYLFSLLPKNNLPGQKILQMDFNLPPAYITQQNGNRYAVWKLSGKDLKPTSIVIYLQVELTPYNITTASQHIPGKRLQDYLVTERNLESQAPQFISIAKELSAGKNDLWIAQSLLQITCERLKHTGFTKDADGALQAWLSRRGDCTDFVDVYVSLCRAAGIPARHVSGLVTDWVYTPGHSWAEIYTENKGWIPVDPLRCYLKTSEFGRMDPVYIRLSDIRNDKLLNNGMLYRWKLANQGKAMVVMTLINRTFSQSGVTASGGPPKNQKKTPAGK